MANFKNLKIFLFAIFLIFSIINSIIANQDQAEAVPAEDEIANGNLLQSPENENVLADLGLKDKDPVTKEEMIKAYEAVLLRKEFQEEELRFFREIIAQISKDLPETIENKNIRGYFDVQYLMKYVNQGSGEPVTEEIKDEKEDM